MTEEESELDFSTEKKKKKKKKGFALEDDIAPAPETETVKDAAPEPAPEAPVDVDDALNFDGAKKKKKKAKAPIDLDLDAPAEPTPAAAPAAEPDVSQVADDLGELNLETKKKKKVKAAPAPVDLDAAVAAAAETAVAVDDELGELTLDGAKKKKKKKDKAAAPLTDGVDAANEQKAEDENVDYEYSELLARVFNIMRERNPEAVAGKKRHFVMKPPQVSRVSTTRTAFGNFAEICKLLHRPLDHVMGFLLAELGTSGSIDGSDALIFKGRFQQKMIESVLRAYIREYVTCHTCKSPDTILAKENRLFFLQCESCQSKCSVASIKTGFQAVTGKRSQIRQKEG